MGCFTVNLRQGAYIHRECRRSEGGRVLREGGGGAGGGLNKLMVMLQLTDKKTRTKSVVQAANKFSFKNIFCTVTKSSENS